MTFFKRLHQARTLDVILPVEVVPPFQIHTTENFPAYEVITLHGAPRLCHFPSFLTDARVLQKMG